MSSASACSVPEDDDEPQLLRPSLMLSTAITRRRMSGMSASKAGTCVPRLF